MSHVRIRLTTEEHSATKWKSSSGTRYVRGHATTRCTDQVPQKGGAGRRRRACLADLAKDIATRTIATGMNHDMAPPTAARVNTAAKPALMTSSARNRWSSRLRNSSGVPARATAAAVTRARNRSDHRSTGPPSCTASVCARSRPGLHSSSPQPPPVDVGTGAAARMTGLAPRGGWSPTGWSSCGPGGRATGPGTCSSTERRRRSSRATPRRSGQAVMVRSTRTTTENTRSPAAGP